MAFLRNASEAIPLIVFSILKQNLIASIKVDSPSNIEHEILDAFQNKIKWENNIKQNEENLKENEKNLKQDQERKKHKDENMTTKNSANILFMRSK